MELNPFLDQVVSSTKKLVEKEKESLSTEYWEERIASHQRLLLNGKFKKDSINIITEVKYFSPLDKSVLSTRAPEEIAGEYIDHGSRAISVLTEPEFFKGSFENLGRIKRKYADHPCLMKDFVVDEYQILKGMAHGADSVLLIAGVLGEKRTEELYRLCVDRGLYPLVEIHDESEIDFINKLAPRFVGVNNRDLKSLKVDISRTENFLEKLNTDIVKISESGFRTNKELNDYRMKGVDGFLIGTSLMKNDGQGEKLSRLINEG